MCDDSSTIDEDEMEQFPAQKNLKAWIEESNALIEKRRRRGVWNTSELRRLIDEFERRLQPMTMTGNNAQQVVDNTLAVELRRRAVEVYKLLIALARER